MRVEIIHGLEKGFGLRLVPESDPEQEQLRELKGLGIEAKVLRVEFSVPRRRKRKEDQSTLPDVDV